MTITIQYTEQNGKTHSCTTKNCIESDKPMYLAQMERMAQYDCNNLSFTMLVNGEVYAQIEN